jgi:protein involved in polysaccharide export with SLBB domain
VATGEKAQEEKRPMRRSVILGAIAVGLISAAVLAIGIGGGEIPSILVTAATPAQEGVPVTPLPKMDTTPVGQGELLLDEEPGDTIIFEETRFQEEAPASMPINTTEILALASRVVTEIPELPATMLHALENNRREPPPPVRTLGVDLPNQAVRARTMPDSIPIPFADSNSYRLQPGDLVDVFVWDQPLISGKSRVARDGTIVVRLVGSVRISGYSVDQAAAVIARGLVNQIIDPSVTVTIAELGGKDVMVVGEVARPGPLSLERPMTILDALVQADWKRDNADLTAVRISRGATSTTYDIDAVLHGQKLDQNVRLDPGDIIVVPPREQVVNLLGAFTSPGKYVFPSAREVRVRDLLLEKSRWAPTADITRAFVLRSDGKTEPVNMNALWFQGDVSHDKTLAHGDALVIPELQEIAVYILGKVGTPGMFTRRGSFNLMQALTAANPNAATARIYDIRIVRGWPSNPQVIRLDLKTMLEGRSNPDIMLQNGDVVFVPETPISMTLDFWNRLLGPIAGVASTVRSVENN